jgi:hypothetical protein
MECDSQRILLTKFLKMLGRMDLALSA